MARVSWPFSIAVTLEHICDLHNGTYGTIPIPLYKLPLGGKGLVLLFKLGTDLFHHSSLRKCTIDEGGTIGVVGA